MCKGDKVTIKRCGSTYRVKIKKVLPDGYFLGKDLQYKGWMHIFKATALVIS